MSPRAKAQFHVFFAKIFREGSARVEPGTWTVEFQGKMVRMPLSAEQMWLEWDSAVSLVGHDVDVKETYAALLASPAGPDLFVDIGANYGIHSLLFLVHGVDTLSFEPNSSCHGYFRLLSRANGVEPNIQHVALGAAEGNLQLVYPERDTWLGSTDAAVKSRLASKADLVTERVEQKTLDAYLPQFLGKRVLVKIDTEGNELAVLQGAMNTLERVRPKIIFESWGPEVRASLFEFLGKSGYQVQPLRLPPNLETPPLTYDEFMNSAAQNFIAVPTVNGWSNV